MLISIASQLSHVAILVRSVIKVADYLRPFGFNIGEAEVFEGEGTKEIYVEADKAGSLLLLEAIKPGAYQRALEKRGPGLHHIAIDVLNLQDYLVSLTSSGWLLHPISVKTMKHKTAYLARPGFPGLIEVQEKKDLLKGPLFVRGISLQMSKDSKKLLSAIGLDSIVKASDSPTELLLSDQNILLEDILI